MAEPEIEHALVCEPSGRLQCLPLGVDPSTYPLDLGHEDCTGHLITSRRAPAHVEQAVQPQRIS